MQAGISSLASDAMARRRMLLKSLGKGTSVVAVAATGSIHTLASGALTFTASGSRCTMSGTVSGIHSKDTTKDTCGGRSPLAYKSTANWPPASNGRYTAGVVTFTSASTFTSVFGPGSTSTSSLATIMAAVTTIASASVEAVWITALLNALPNSGALNFPYTAEKVVAFYKSTTDRSGAYTFFKDYMQTRS